MAGGFLESFAREFVFWVKIHCGAEFRRGPYARIFQEQRVSAFDVSEDHLGPEHLARRQKIQILRSQPGGLIELRIRLFNVLMAVQFQSAIKSFPRVFEILLRDNAIDSADQPVRAGNRWRGSVNRTHEARYR